MEESSSSDSQTHDYEKIAGRPQCNTVHWIWYLIIVMHLSVSVGVCGVTTLAHWLH